MHMAGFNRSYLLCCIFVSCNYTSSNSCLYCTIYTGRQLTEHNSWLKLLFLIQQQLRLINLKMFAVVVVMSNASISHGSHSLLSHWVCPPTIQPSNFFPPSQESNKFLSSYEGVARTEGEGEFPTECARRRL